MSAAPQVLRQTEHVVLRSLRPDGPAARVATIATTASSRGVLWAGITAAAQLHERLRVPSRTALAAWAAASTLAAASKQVVRRQRPALVARLGPTTMSSSMPSSHTAGAAAYATAAALAEPWTAIVLVPLAGLVGWSRLATGRHFPTDVAAGVVLGVATGAAAHVVAKRLLAEPQQRHA